LDRFTLAIFSLIFLVLGLMVVSMVYYFNNTEIVEVSSPIREKYMYSDTGGVIVINPSDEGPGIGVPIKNMVYVFILEDNTEHKVTREEFLKYRIGDLYTYRIRKWKR